MAKAKVTEKLIETIKKFEGLRLRAYRDAGGVPTIGYGHTRNVHDGMRITDTEADSFLRSDVATAAAAVLKELPAATPPQLDALTDFVFNLGAGSFRESTLLRYIKEGKSEAEIRQQFGRWIYCNGRKLEGLVKRRRWEADRYFDNN